MLPVHRRSPRSTTFHGQTLRAQTLRAQTLRAQTLRARARGLAAALAGAALAACADPLAVDSSATAPQPSASVAALASADGRYLVRGGGVASAAFAARVAALGGTVEYAHAGAGFAIASGLSAQAAAALRGSGSVAEIVPDVTVSLDPVPASEPIAADALPASPLAPQMALFYPRQWHLRAIGADEAWAAGRLGSSDVTVAILDTGIDYLHADLAGRVDLARSASFVPGDDALVAALFPTRHPCTDLHYHGTHVAATVSSNAFAAAGVTSQVTLMCVKVLGVDGSGSFAGILQGILHAADNGADVLNMSIQGGFQKRGGQGSFAGMVNTVLNYAHRQGVTSIVAAGNAAHDLDHDQDWYQTFCNSTAVTCVSATGPTASAGVDGPWQNVDAPAPYTNFGRSAINVAAPGGSTGGVVWEACSSSSLVIPICQTGTFVVGLAGTSMASPHTAGLAALLVEDLGASPARIRARLQQSADDLGQRGTDPFYGKGRINVPRALGLE